MTQTSNRFLDELARLMTDAIGATEGVRREAETFMRARAEKLVEQMDLVPREDFEAMRELAQRTREEQEQLAARVRLLEEKLGVADKAQG